jgi:hypothetical protein
VGRLLQKERQKALRKLKDRTQDNIWQKMLKIKEFSSRPEPKDIVEEYKQRGIEVISLTYFPLLNNNWFVFIFCKPAKNINS